MMLGETLIAYSEEFLPGKDLRALIKDGWHPEEAELRSLFITLLTAIKSLWELPNRVIHRDIKPDNIIRLADRTRPFVLLDLGIAFAVFDTALTVNPDQRLPVGTFPYLAPELFQPNFRDTIDYRCDLYAAALTVYECATGRHPLAREGEYLVKTLTRILQDTPPPLLSSRPDLSPVLCSMVDGMLKKRPPLRPANLSALIKQLQS
jgi:serine/threonine protein kinase